MIKTINDIISQLNTNGSCYINNFADNLAEIMAKLQLIGLDFSLINNQIILNKALNLTTQDQLKQRLQQYEITATTEIFCFNFIDSTNDFLLKKSCDKAVCVAHCQDLGRGRRGRKWHSPLGQNLYFSYKTPIDKTKTNLIGLSAVVAILVAQALQNIGLNQVEIKWPNDIYVNGAKLGGILIDGITNQKSHYVIGIGLNLKMQDDKAQIDQPWCSLSDYLQDFDYSNLVAQLSLQLQSFFDNFNQENITAKLLQWHKFDYLYDKAVCLIADTQKTYATAKGIDYLDGAIILQDSDGNQSKHNIGEISLRLI